MHQQSFTAFLKESAQRTGSIACVGLDPERLPIQGDPEHAIAAFCIGILDAFARERCVPGAIKLNSAFYERHGVSGMRALEKVIVRARELEVPFILDAKRADIGKTSEAYASAAYDALRADAVTVAPYMGRDSIAPFVARSTSGKGCYVLVRTSNPGARDIQDLVVDGDPLWLRVASELVSSWAQPGTGAVVGATYPDELSRIARLFASSGKEIPLLIPGVGAQGASAEKTVRALRDAGYDLSLCRINSSSGIMYAYEKEGTGDYGAAAVRALRRLNDEIGQWK